ncbi:MAG TPA: M24 family metallopeptidase [Actinomycetota bacterium]|nr:M24 family metallopeptidase [Actinomycetota bacterium]
MTTYLLYDDALRSPELRHEIQEPIMDPVIFIDHDEKRVLVGGPLEQPVMSTRDDVVDEFWSDHELGSEELIKDDSVPDWLIGAELVKRALDRLGARSVVVPSTFHVAVADYLRGKDITVMVDPEAWAARRRRKTPWELEGIERAQRAVDTAMLTAARMLREAEPTASGTLRFQGEILTAELIREGMKAELLRQGAESEEIIVHSGDACLSGHEIGHGPILPNHSCIVDCFPRERRSGVFTDMTRTFVPGKPSKELLALHTHCKNALEIALETIRPGRADAYDKVAGYFEKNDLPTFRSHSGPGPLEEGFFHSLGHGVGLQLHERPWMGRRSDEIVEGDVVAIEPGLYFRGVGGVRLEDTVVVTESGIEHFTDPYPYDLTP